MVAMRILFDIYSPPSGLKSHLKSVYNVISTMKNIETDLLVRLKLSLKRSESPI